MQESVSNETIYLSTVLPLIAIRADLQINLNNNYEELASGYRIVKREYLSTLDKFQADVEYSEINLTSALQADYYLQIRKEYPFPRNLVKIRDQGHDDAGETFERFLLAMNLHQKLWSFRPYVRFSWFEDKDPENWRRVSYGNSNPLSTFEGTIDIQDFRRAGHLTAKIDEIYAERSDKAFPALKTAFSALRLGSLAFNTSMRFLQEAIVLEALCSTDTYEATHKIASTCALLLGPSNDERKEIYARVKRLYGIRSRIIHGAGGGAKVEEVKEMECISRGVVLCILEGSRKENYRTISQQKDFLLDLWMGMRT